MDPRTTLLRSTVRQLLHGHSVAGALWWPAVECKWIKCAHGEADPRIEDSYDTIRYEMRSKADMTARNQKLKSGKQKN